MKSKSSAEWLERLEAEGVSCAPVQRAVDLGKEFRRTAPPSDEERKILFNQTARSARKG